MRAKVREKEQVLALRRKGQTYSEILKKVAVSKSSVSTWLKDHPLTDKEKKILKAKKEEGISRGRIRAAASLRSSRESRDKELFQEAKSEFMEYSKDSFFQLGLGLYWAEGAKRSSSFGFTNSDPEMVKIMIRWIRKFLNPSEEEIRLRLYTHKAFAHENQESFWSEISGIPLSRFGKTVYKSQGLVVKKRPNYSGCVRVELGKVMYLRKLLYWQQMLIEYYKEQE